MRFKKSSYSSGSAETCVEIALPEGIPAPILIRDSKRPTGPTLYIHPTAYTAFTQALRQDALGRPGTAVTLRRRTMRPASYMAPSAEGAPYRWLTEAAKLGGEARSKLLEVAEVTPAADVAVALNIAKGDTALLRRQILLIDDEPVELVKCYYPLEIARGTALMERRRIKGGTPTLLAELGFPPRLSVDKVSARVPTQEEFNALRLPSGLPVLRTLRTLYSDDERPVEVAVMAKAGHLYELQYEFTAQ